MNKQLIIKWCKKVGIVIASVIGIFFLYALSYYVYEDYYVLRRIESLYQEGLENPNKAEDNIKQLLKEHGEDSQTKALNLMKFYANKKELWTQIMLEKYNYKYGITLNSIIPINRHIWGINIGKSTKQDVLNYLDSMDLWHQELKKGSVTQVYKDFEFAGVFWNAAYCYFTNYKIYKIAFVYRPKGSPSDSFDKLRGILAAKYTISKNFNQEELNYSWDKFSIKDSLTLIELETNCYDRNPTHKELILKYTNLEKKKRKLEQDIKNI